MLKEQKEEASNTICRAIFWALVLGYAVFGYSNDPEHCYASDTSEFRITDARE